MIQQENHFQAILESMGLVFKNEMKKGKYLDETSEAQLFYGLEPFNRGTV